MSTGFTQVSDRPGAGDSPESQGQKTWRLETSFVGYNEANEVQTYALAQSTYLIRGFKSSEVQIGQTGGLRWSSPGSGDTDSSFGEPSLRYKYTLGRLFCDACRFGLLATITGPERNKSRLKNYEKVLSVPMSFGLSSHFSLGVNLAWTHVRDFNSTDSAFVLNYTASDKLVVFVQQVVSTNKSNLDEESFSSGLGAAYLWQKSWQLDAEFNQGISSIDQSSDFQVGMTYWFN
jgi:hypothetical protein